eukprot:3657052-Rhodomonas_salina.1
MCSRTCTLRCASPPIRSRRHTPGPRILPSCSAPRSEHASQSRYRAPRNSASPPPTTMAAATCRSDQTSARGRKRDVTCPPFGRVTRSASVSKNFFRAAVDAPS